MQNVLFLEFSSAISLTFLKWLLVCACAFFFFSCYFLLPFYRWAAVAAGAAAVSALSHPGHLVGLSLNEGRPAVY